MATVRSGAQAVLLVVDVQVGVMSQLWDSHKVIGNVARLVQRARDEHVPVIWIQHEAEHLPRGSDEWKIVPELAPADGEPVIPKEYNSAFERTSLEAELARLGATCIVLAGAASNWCIRATAYGGLANGYDLMLVSDAHTTHDMETEAGEPIPAKHIIDELNTVIDWLRYPSLVCRVASATDLDFESLSQPA